MASQGQGEDEQVMPGDDTSMIAIWDRQKVGAASGRFNARALVEGWESRCDTSLGFFRPQLTELLSIWEEKAKGTVPPRSAFDPRSLKNVMSNMLIVERVDAGPERRWRFRYFGSELVKLLGEYTNRDLHEALPKAHAERWSFTYDCVTQEPSPIRIVSSYQLAKINYLDGEGLILPLTDEKGDVSLVLSATYVRQKTFKT